MFIAPRKGQGPGASLEVRRVYLVKSRGERGYEGEVEDHDYVVSFSQWEKVPKSYRNWTPYYSVYQSNKERIVRHVVDLDYHLHADVPSAVKDLDRKLNGVRRNPDDFSNDDGGSERRRMGPGGITPTERGGFVAEGPRGIEIYRLLAIRSGLRIESLGMKMSRGVSCLKLAKQVTGLKASTAAKMLPLYEAWLRERGLLRDEKPVRGNPIGRKLTFDEWTARVIRLVGGLDENPWGVTVAEARREYLVGTTPKQFVVRMGRKMKGNSNSDL